MKAELGDLDRVTLTLKVVGMVNSNPSFTKQASVVDGTSGSFRTLLLYKGQACLWLVSSPLRAAVRPPHRPQR